MHRKCYEDDIRRGRWSAPVGRGGRCL